LGLIAEELSNRKFNLGDILGFELKKKKEDNLSPSIE
jgi:hypothetical protein